MTIANIIDPAVQPKRLSDPPCLVDSARPGKSEQLISDVHFDKAINLAFITFVRRQLIVMIAHYVSRMIEPTVQGTRDPTSERRLNAPATVVTAYDDVRNLEDLDSKLQSRHEVEIVGIDEVGDVPMNEHPAGWGHGHLLGADPAVGTPYPQKLRRLLKKDRVGSAWWMTGDAGHRRMRRVSGRRGLPGQQLEVVCRGSHGELLSCSGEASQLERS